MPTYVKRVGPGSRLTGRRVAIIAANEFEDVELLYPFLRLSEEGAEIVIVPMRKGLHPRPSVINKPVTGRYGTPIPLEVFGFGVGTSISNAPTVDFAMDIVEVEGKPIAKRGKFSGRKDVWRCPECLRIDVEPIGSSRPSCPSCGIGMENILEPLMKDGKIIVDLPRPSDIRSYVLRQLSKVCI